MAKQANNQRIIVRRARTNDAPLLAELSGQLGYPATAAEITKRMRKLRPASQNALFVAEAPRCGSCRLGARQRNPPCGGRNSRGIERADSRRRPAQSRSWCPSAGSRGGLGPQARLPEHVRAVKRDSRARPQVLRTSGLRALQDTESLPQVALTFFPYAPLAVYSSVNRSIVPRGKVYRITIYLG